MYIKIIRNNLQEALWLLPILRYTKDLEMRAPVKYQSGFTIIELLLVVVFVGLLGALAFSTHAGIARNQRNQDRQQNIQAIYKQLESYYVETTYYPTLAELNSNSWRIANMKTLADSTFRDPSGTSNQLVSEPAARVYSYDVTAANGSTCDNKTKACAHYTLTATLEGTGPQKTYVKSSLN